MLDIIAQFNEYTKANPVMAGVVSMWGLGSLTYLCRKVPLEFVRSVIRQVTTSVSFDNSPMGWSQENYTNFLTWFNSTHGAAYSRSLALTPRYGGTGEDSTQPMQLGVGVGTHFSFYKRRLLIVEITSELAGGSQRHIMKVTVTLLGRSQQVLNSLLDEFSIKHAHLPRVYTYKNDWKYAALRVPRRLETVIVADSIKQSLVADIQLFLKSREWYADRGIPYKMVVVLHGIPGTGKTSLIRALATYFNYSLGLLNLAEMTDASLQYALATAIPDSMVVIEDFDSSNATKGRRDVAKSLPSSDQDSIPEFLTLAGVLNSLDGLLPLDGTIVFMTTNVLDTIDKALTRKGRVDHIYEMGALTHTEVVSYVRLMFPDYDVDSHVVFADIIGCDLQALYFKHAGSAEAFVASIPVKDQSIRLVRN